MQHFRKVWIHWKYKLLYIKYKNHCMQYSTWDAKHIKTYEIKKHQEKVKTGLRKSFVPNLAKLYKTRYQSFLLPSNIAWFLYLVILDPYNGNKGFFWNLYFVKLSVKLKITVKESIFPATLPVEWTHSFNIQKYLRITATNPNKTAKYLENSITCVLY